MFTFELGADMAYVETHTVHKNNIISHDVLSNVFFYETFESMQLSDILWLLRRIAKCMAWTRKKGRSSYGTRMDGKTCDRALSRRMVSSTFARTCYREMGFSECVLENEPVSSMGM